MADIYDTLHPVNTPADNLYPNIKPEQNIPDGSISKQKLNFSIGGQGAAAILPGEEYVDIAYNGNPGSVLFPKGTYFIYTRDGWLNNTPPYTGTYNTVSDDFEVMAYWYDVSENVIKSSEATPSNDGIILSIPEDDFLVMVLIKNPNENGPRAIPVYSIIPTSLLKYNTRDYDWASLQVTGFTINDGEYPQLGSGYLVDQFSTPVVSANTNYYKICSMKILSADIGRDTVSASAIVWIAATTGSTINTAFVSLNLVMDTLTHDYSASGATIVGGAFDSGKLVYVVNFDDQQSTLTIELYAALSKDAMLAAGNVCYVRYRDAQGDRQSTVPFFYGTDTGSASAPSNSIPVKQIGTAFNPEGAYPNLGAGYLAKTDTVATANNSAQYGWWRFARLPFSTLTKMTGTSSYSAILLVNSANPPGIDGTNAIQSGIIELDLRLDGGKPTSINTNDVMKVLCGGLSPDLFCCTVSDTEIEFYVNLNAAFNRRNFTVFNEVYYDREHVDALEFEPTFVSSSAPANAIYAVNRNMAAYDGDGNVISETYAKKSEVTGGGGAQQLTNEDLNEMIGAEYWGKDYYADEGNGVMYAPTLNGEAFYLQIRHGGDDFTVQFIAVIDIQRVAVRCWHRFISSTIGSAWIEIATEDSEDGAKTAYHHHIQAELRSAQPEPTAHYKTTATAIFEIVTDSADPITSSADLYDALMGLAWTTTETRWTPATGGIWVDEIPDDPDMYPSAWPVVGIRALAQARPDDPGIDSRSIEVMVYRVGKTRQEGPLQQVPFYYSGFASWPSNIYDTVTDQYGTYIAGGD